AGQLSRILLELALQPLEQGEGVGGRAGKAADDVALAEPADLFGIGFDDGLADRDLAVAADHHLATLADGQNGGAVPDRRLIWGCLHEMPSCPARFRGSETPLQSAEFAHHRLKFSLLSVIPQWRR